MTVIDEYMQKIDTEQRAELERVRQIVKEVVPEASEVISYGIPVMKYNDKYLIGFAAFKNHMSVFPGGEPVSLLASGLKDYKTSKGTVQFTTSKPLPEHIIKQLTVMCLDRITSS